jgi:hypothetical protein
MASQDCDAHLDPPGACAVTKIFDRSEPRESARNSERRRRITCDCVVSRAIQWRPCLFPRLPHARLVSAGASPFNQEADIICMRTVACVFLRFSDNVGIERAESERLARIVNKCELLDLQRQLQWAGYVNWRDEKNLSTPRWLYAPGNCCSATHNQHNHLNGYRGNDADCAFGYLTAWHAAVCFAA